MSPIIINLLQYVYIRRVRVMVGIGVDRDQVEGAVIWRALKKTDTLLYFNYLKRKDDVTHQLSTQLSTSFISI